MKVSRYDAVVAAYNTRVLNLAMQQTKEIMAAKMMNNAFGPQAWDGAWYATYLAAHAAALRARALDNHDGD